MSHPAPDAAREVTGSPAQALLEAYAALGRFCGVAAASRSGRLVLSAAFGLADRQRAIPNRIGTRFLIGSISKQFTAAAVLKLAAEGALAVSDPIGRYLADLRLPYAGSVTLHHLLSHTGGVPSLFQPHLGIALAEDRACRPTSRQGLIEEIRDLPLRFPPGVRCEYSNTGYSLLAMVVERVSGSPYLEYLAREILGPAGLAHTGRADSGPDRAIGHVAGQAVHPPDPTWLLGCGDLRSTALDLLAWHDALGRYIVLPPSALAQMFAEHAQAGPDVACGYGHWIGKRLGRRVLFHGGALAGCVASCHRYPEADLTVVVLTNQVPAWSHLAFTCRLVDRIATQCAAAILGEKIPFYPPLPVPSDPDRLRGLTGTYALAGGLAIDVFLAGGGLRARTRGERPFTLWGLDQLAEVEGTPRGRRCAALVAALAERRFVDALALFAMAHAERLTPAGLATVWDAISHHLGPAPAFHLVQVLDDVAHVRGRPARPGGPGLDLRIVFDSEDCIIGLHTAAPAEGVAADEVRLIAEGNDRFRSDGYPLGVEDVPITFERTAGTARTLTLHLPGGPITAQAAGSG